MDKPKKRRGNNGNHGNHNSGRRPKLITIAKRELIKNKIEEADKSFSFMVSVRDTIEMPPSLRIAAAQWIWETVMGKPVQRISDEMTPEDRKAIELYYKSLGLKKRG